MATFSPLGDFSWLCISGKVVDNGFRIFLPTSFNQYKGTSSLLDDLPFSPNPSPSIPKEDTVSSRLSECVNKSKNSEWEVKPEKRGPEQRWRKISFYLSPLEMLKIFLRLQK